MLRLICRRVCLLLLVSLLAVAIFGALQTPNTMAQIGPEDPAYDGGGSGGGGGGGARSVQMEQRAAILGVTKGRIWITP